MAIIVNNVSKTIAIHLRTIVHCATSSHNSRSHSQPSSFVKSPRQYIVASLGGRSQQETMKYKVQHFQLILILLTIIAPLKYQPVHFSSLFSLPKTSYYTQVTLSTSPSTLEKLGLRPPKQLSRRRDSGSIAAEEDCKSKRTEEERQGVHEKGEKIPNAN
jgi:hypothetical protein